MKLSSHILVAPFIAFGMIILWAVTGIPTIGDKNVMFEEWIVCMAIYFCVVIILRVKKLFTS